MLNCSTTQVLFKSTWLGNSLSQSVPIEPISALISNYSTSTLFQEILSAWPVLVPFLALVAIIMAAFVACCFQLVCRNYVKCCKDSPYSTTNIARSGICLAIIGLVVILMGSITMLVVNDARIAINKSLCQSRQVLMQLSNGSVGITSSTAALNLSDVRYNSDQLTIIYTNLMETAQRPFLDSSTFLFPNTTNLNIFYDNFCSALSIKSPETGQDITINPYQQSCDLIKAELDSWIHTISSLTSIQAEMGSDKALNTVFKDSFITWLNQVISGSYIISYSTALALINVTTQVEEVEPTVDLFLLIGYIVPLVLALTSCVFTLVLVLLPFMLYQYSLLKGMYASWCCSTCSTLLLICFSGGVMGLAFFSGQVASTFKDLTINPNNYNLSLLSMPDNFLLCMSNPTSLYFNIPPPTPVNYYQILKNVVDAYSSISIPTTTTFLSSAKQLYQDMSDDLSTPQHLTSESLSAYYRLNNCSRATSSERLSGECEGPNIQFVFSTIQCGEESPTVSTPLLENSYYCIQLQSGSPICTRCNPNPTYPTNTNFSTLSSASQDLFILDTCDACKSEVSSLSNNLNAYGLSVGPILNQDLAFLELYLEEMEEGFYEVNSFLNPEWQSAMNVLVPVFGQFSYGFECQATISHMLLINSIFEDLTGQLILSSILLIILTLCSIIQSQLTYMMTSRLRLYYLKMGHTDQTLLESDQEELPKIDWEKIRQEQQNETEAFKKIFKEAYEKHVEKKVEGDISSRPLQSQQPAIILELEQQQQDISSQHNTMKQSE